MLNIKWIEGFKRLWTLQQVVIVLINILLLTCILPFCISHKLIGFHFKALKIIKYTKINKINLKMLWKFHKHSFIFLLHMFANFNEKCIQLDIFQHIHKQEKKTTEYILRHVTPYTTKIFKVKYSKLLVRKIKK